MSAAGRHALHPGGASGRRSRLPAGRSRIRCAAPLGLALALSLTAHAAVAGDWRRFDADVRDPGNTRLLYRESHYVRSEGPAERWVVYRCPDGRAFARKHVDGDGAAPGFALEDGRGGYAEGVRGKGATRVAYVRQAGTYSERRISVGATGVIDAGFDAAVRTHWDALMAGKPLHLAFLVPSRQRFFPVRVQHAGDTLRHGVRAARLRMQLDSWFGFAVPDVQLVYARDDQRLLEFSGTGNIRDTRGGNPQVRIGFAVQPRDATGAEVAALRVEPLLGRCTF